MVVENNKAVTISCCYIHEDKKLSHELALHLSVLKRVGFVQAINEHEINIDESWEENVDQHTDKANIILLSISSAFIDSNYCNSKELRSILEKHQQGKVHVIPVLLYPVAWKHSPIGVLEALPTEEKAVSSWSITDEALVNVVKGAREAIKFYWTRQKMSQIVLELQQLSSELNKIADETQQISREIEQIKPDLAESQYLSASSETKDAPVRASTVAYNFTKEVKEYQEALSMLQNAVHNQCLSIQTN